MLIPLLAKGGQGAVRFSKRMVKRECPLLVASGRSGFGVFCVGQTCFLHSRPSARIEMLRSFALTPLRFWFRLAVVATVLWFIIASLWHWKTLAQEMVAQDIHQIAICQSSRIVDTSGCLARAVTQLNNNRSNAISLAISESALQIVLLWVVGAIVIFGIRWAVRALD